MKTNTTARYGRISGISAAASGVAGSLIAGLIGWLWWVLADGAAWVAIVLAAVLALPAVVSIMWQHSRARDERRLLAALDEYAAREQSNWT